MQKFEEFGEPRSRQDGAGGHVNRIERLVVEQQATELLAERVLAEFQLDVGRLVFAAAQACGLGVAINAGLFALGEIRSGAQQAIGQPRRASGRRGAQGQHELRILGQRATYGGTASGDLNLGERGRVTPHLVPGTTRAFGAHGVGVIVKGLAAVIGFTHGEIHRYFGETPEVRIPSLQPVECHVRQSVTAVERAQIIGQQTVHVRYSHGVGRNELRYVPRYYRKA